MKRLTLLLLVATLAGCASGPAGHKSSAHVVIPGNTQLGQTDWIPNEQELADLEAQLGTLLLNPDARVQGIGDMAPPYPLKDYLIRFTVTGPKDSAFILGEAVHKSRPEAATHLDPKHPAYDLKKVHGAYYFTFVFDVKFGTVREILFATP